MKDNRIFKLIGLMVPTAIMWAGAFIAGKFTTNALPVFTLCAMRFAIALVPLAVFALVRRTLVLPKLRDLPLLIMLSLMGILGYHVLFFIALRYTTATNSSLIVALIPLMTVMLSRIFFADRVSVWQLLCFLLSLFGVALVITKGDFAGVIHRGANAGDLLMLVASLMFAVYSAFSRKMLAKYSALNALIYMFAIACIIMLFFMPFEKPLPYIAAMDSKGWIALVYMGLFASAAGYLIQQISIREFGASRTMLFNNLVPIITIFLSAWLLNEKAVLIDYIALVMIVTGLLLNTYISSRRDGINVQTETQGAD